MLISILTHALAFLAGAGGVFAFFRKAPTTAASVGNAIADEANKITEKKPNPPTAQP